MAAGLLIKGLFHGDFAHCAVGLDYIEAGLGCDGAFGAGVDAYAAEGVDLNLLSTADGDFAESGGDIESGSAKVHGLKGSGDRLAHERMESGVHACLAVVGAEEEGVVAVGVEGGHSVTLEANVHGDVGRCRAGHGGFEARCDAHSLLVALGGVVLRSVPCIDRFEMLGHYEEVIALHVVVVDAVGDGAVEHEFLVPDVVIILIVGVGIVGGEGAFDEVGRVGDIHTLLVISTPSLRVMTVPSQVSS